MRESRHSSLTWSSLGWLMPMAFLALPDCGFPGNPIIYNLDKGPKPLNWVVFCDIRKFSDQPRCATPDDLAKGVLLSHAAVSLTKENTWTVALDYSPQNPKHAECLPDPVAIPFEGSFPEGYPVCLNAPVVLGPGKPYADADAVCRAQCRDFFGTTNDEGTFRPAFPTPPDVVAFCQEHARASTSFPVEYDPFEGDALAGFSNACDDAGALRAEFDDPAFPEQTDPRRIPEPVPFRFASTGVTRSGLDLNTLTRTAATSGQYDQGAASLHFIARGDGQVDVTVVETNTTRAFGLSTGISSDTDPTLADIDFGVVLEAASSPGSAGNLQIYEGGNPIPPLNGIAFATYAAGDRVRIKFLDNFDGTASIAYFVIPASCQGPLCEGPLLRLSGPLAYPLHVDTSLLTQGATLSDIRMVRIKTWNF